MILQRLKRRAGRFLFERAAQDILSSAPLHVRPAQLRIVTMLQGRDLLMYLGAIKSLYLRLGEGDVIVVDDGTMGEAGLELLRWHIRGLTVVKIGEIGTGLCPRGGTWERLLLIHDLSRTAFVIQMDADTLSLGGLEAVRAAYAENVSFALGTSSGKTIVSAAEISAWTATIQDSGDISYAAESRMKELRGAEGLRYVRASSGFAGFARGTLDRGRLEEFSVQMREMVGSRWDEWGSEQVASNFTVANSPGAVVLPYPAYSCYFAHPDIDYRRNEFVHFIGSHRYHQGLYADCYRRLIEEVRTV